MGVPPVIKLKHTLESSDKAESAGKARKLLMCGEPSGWGLVGIFR